MKFLCLILFIILYGCKNTTQSSIPKNSSDEWIVSLIDSLDKDTSFIDFQSGFLNDTVTVNKKSKFIITTNPSLGFAKRLYISKKQAIKNISVNNFTIFIDDTVSRYVCIDKGLSKDTFVVTYLQKRPVYE